MIRVVAPCHYSPVLLPIARSAYAHDVALWVAGGDQTAFTSAMAMHETDSWTGRHTGGVDESLASFDEHERWIARLLARQGYNVIALPTRHLAGLRSPDAVVGGLLVEFKTYTSLNPRQLLCRVLKAWPQADRVVVGVAAPWDPTLVRSVLRAATDSARQRGIRAVMFISDDFQLEWGDWNARFTPSTTTAQSVDHLQLGSPAPATLSLMMGFRPGSPSLRSASSCRSAGGPRSHRSATNSW